MCFFFLFLSEDPTQIGRGIALVTVLDINDNAPVFAIDYETLLCENTIPGQVRPTTATQKSIRPSLWPFLCSHPTLA